MAAPFEDVLVITGGLAPALVTETLYALAVGPCEDGASPFRPKRVRIVGTAESQAAFEKAGIRDKVAELYAELGLDLVPVVEFDTLAAVDIRSAEGAEEFGNHISKLVRMITANPSVRLHQSLAGGRKSMSFHAGAAMSIYGRAQDQLSHVLVDPPEVEAASNFWWPTRYSVPLINGRTGQPLAGKNGEVLDARDTRIDLAFIPFLRTRGIWEGLKTSRNKNLQTLLDRDLDYAEIVRLAQLALNGAASDISVTLHAPTLTVRVSGFDPFPLRRQLFALYALLAIRLKEQNPGAGPAGVNDSDCGWLSVKQVREPQNFAPNPVEQYLEILHRLGTDTEDDKKPAWTDTSRGAVKSRQQHNQGLFFGTARSDLEKEFEARFFSDKDVRSLLFDAPKRSDDPRFGINLQPEQIEIVWESGPLEAIS